MFNNIQNKICFPKKQNWWAVGVTNQDTFQKRNQLIIEYWRAVMKK